MLSLHTCSCINRLIDTKKERGIYRLTNMLTKVDGKRLTKKKNEKDRIKLLHSVNLMLREKSRKVPEWHSCAIHSPFRYLSVIFQLTEMQSVILWKRDRWRNEWSWWRCMSTNIHFKPKCTYIYTILPRS